MNQLEFEWCKQRKPSKTGQVNYGGVTNTYDEYAIHTAISKDSADAIQDLHDNGLINHETKTFFGTSVLSLVKRLGKKNAENKLIELGYK